jgi:hypothetical protein
MEEDDLRNLLRKRKQDFHARGWRCPGTTELAAFVDRRLDGSARKSLEAHLADCDSCLGQVSFLVHSGANLGSVDVPAHLLAKAQNLVTEKPGTLMTWNWRWATVTVAAACLILTVMIVLARRSRDPESARNPQAPPVAQQPEEHPADVSQPSSPSRNPDIVASSKTPQTTKTPVMRSSSPVPETRNNESQNRSPKLVFPLEGAAMKREALEFRWQAVPDAVFYEVSIMNASGDTITARRTDETRVQLPASEQLTSGTKYFVSVRAHLRDGKTARSSVISFRVVE